MDAPYRDRLAGIDARLSAVEAELAEIKEKLEETEREQEENETKKRVFRKKRWWKPDLIYDDDCRCGYCKYFDISRRRLGKELNSPTFVPAMDKLYAPCARQHKLNVWVQINDKAACRLFYPADEYFVEEQEDE